MSVPPFKQRLAADTALRDAFTAYLNERIARENSLDRVDDSHSLDHQRGRVNELRSMLNDARQIDHPEKEPTT